MNRIAFKDEWEDIKMSVGQDRLAVRRRRKKPSLGRFRIFDYKTKEKPKWKPVQKKETTTYGAKLGVIGGRKEIETIYKPESPKLRRSKKQLT